MIFLSEETSQPPDNFAMQLRKSSYPIFRKVTSVYAHMQYHRKEHVCHDMYVEANGQLCRGTFLLAVF